MNGPGARSAGGIPGADHVAKFIDAHAEGRRGARHTPEAFGGDNPRQPPCLGATGRVGRGGDVANTVDSRAEGRRRTGDAVELGGTAGLSSINVGGDQVSGEDAIAEPAPATAQQAKAAAIKPMKRSGIRLTASGGIDLGK